MLRCVSQHGDEESSPINSPLSLTPEANLDIGLKKTYQKGLCRVFKGLWNLKHLQKRCENAFIKKVFSGMAIVQPKQSLRQYLHAIN